MLSLLLWCILFAFNWNDGALWPAVVWLVWYQHCPSPLFHIQIAAKLDGQTVAMSTSSLRRQVKNIVHNYSEAEIKVLCPSFYLFFFFTFDFLFHILNPICPHLKRDTSLCGKHDVWQLIICYFLATLSALGALVNILKSNDLIRRLICHKLIFRTAWSD